MKRFAIPMAALATLLSSAPVGAQESSEIWNVGGWVHNGSTLGAGRNAVLGEMGWPSLGVALLHGQSDRLDVGGAFHFLYGLEGVPDIAPGMRLNAIARLNLMNGSSFNFGLRASPGLIAYFPSDSVHWEYFDRFEYPFWANPHDSNAMVGLSMPVELIFGIVPVSSLSVHMGVSVPMTLFLAPEVSFILPVQPGGGIEYKVDQALSLTFDARFGPSFFIVPGGNDSYFAFRTLMGIAYRF